MKSQEKYEIIKRLEDGHISKQTVAVKQGLQVHYYKGTKGLVIKTFKEELLFSTNDKVYVLEEILIHEKTFINFDFKPTVEKPKNRISQMQNILGEVHISKTCTIQIYTLS